MLNRIAAMRPVAFSLGSRILVRGKRTVKSAPGAARVVNMLSVLSARKKQPRRLKLCKEDLVRHQVITAAWKIHQRDEQELRAQQLEAQYNKIKEAFSVLKELDPQLYEAANVRSKDTRFPLELRIPTDSPPRTFWESEWTPPSK